LNIAGFLFSLDLSIIFLYDLITYEIPLCEGGRVILVIAYDFPRAVMKFYSAFKDEMERELG